MAAAIPLQPGPVPATTPAGERLLVAAEQLFYRCGIGAVGVDLIAETAGVTKRTLYQRFGSKSDLVCAYLQRRAHRWQTLLLAELTEPADTCAPDDLPLVVYDVAVTWAEQNPRGCAFVNAWAELGDTTHPAVEVVRAEKQWMRDLFRRLVDDQTVADHLHLLYEGAHVTASTLSDPDAYTHAKRAACTVLRVGRR